MQTNTNIEIHNYMFLDQTGPSKLSSHVFMSLLLCYPEQALVMRKKDYHVSKGFAKKATPKSKKKNILFR